MFHKGKTAGWLAGWLAAWLSGCFAGWLAGCLACCLDGGYSRLNESVIGAIRRFSVDSSLRELRTMNAEQKSMNDLLHNTAHLLFDIGEVETALCLAA